MNEFTLNLVKAASVIVFLLALDFVLEMILIRNIKERKKSLKFRVFVRYVLAFIFLFSMARIWVEGFGYLLTFVGIIAAALTITQKEYLMNFIGWLILMWRDHFTEGDYIEIGRYMGHVRKMGPFFISLEETSDFGGDKTGRIIKIPNSYTATNPVFNITSDHSFLEGKAKIIFSMDSSLESLRNLIKELEKELDQMFSSLYGKCQKPQFLLRLHQHSPFGIQLKVRYLALKQDQRNIDDNIFAIVMRAVNTRDDLKLSTQS